MHIYDKNEKMIFIKYKNDKKIKPCCIKFPQLDGYVNSFREPKYLSLSIENDQLPKNAVKCRIELTIWEKHLIAS